MNVIRCKKCGCVFEGNETNCPTCGSKNSGRKMFYVQTYKASRTKIKESVLSNQSSKEESGGIKKLPLILFGIFMIPFVVIWELTKGYSAKR